MANRDREYKEQQRLRDRIGGYLKHSDNILMHNPDPQSSHFISESERYNKDFASYDKMVREQERVRKNQIMESKR